MSLPFPVLLSRLVPVNVESVMSRSYSSQPLRLVHKGFNHADYERDQNLSREELLARAFPIRGELRQVNPAPVTVTVATPADLQTRWALADELSPVLQLALLSIRWTDLGRACAAKLKQDGIWVCAEDREQLRRAGLAVKTPGKDYDTLTLQGQWKADDCARIVARKYNLHSVTRGGGYRAHTLRCSCGWSTQFTCTPEHKERAFALHELRHLDQVSA